MELKIYPKVRDVATAIGWVLLLYHFATRGFDFRWEGFFLTLVISVFSPLITLSIEVSLKYYRNGRSHIITTKERKDAFASSIKLRTRWQENPLRELWSNGQEGLYKLPLLYIAITPLTVPLYAVLARFNVLVRKDWTTFIGGVTMIMLISWIALPYGMAGVLLGTATIQILLALLNLIALDRYERLEPSPATSSTPKRKARRIR